MDALSAIFAQHPYRCRLDWGPAGVRRAATRDDIVVIVDVLRFSTTTVAAVSQGALIYPCAPSDDTNALAHRMTAQVTTHGPDPTASHPDALSPASYDRAAPGTGVVLPSLNGAACVRAAQEAPYVLIGALVNAQAVGTALSTLLTRTNAAATIIACGERWSVSEDPRDGGLRVALEDYLGAGAILSYLPFDKSPEAAMCEVSFRAARDSITELVWEAISGRELRHQGKGADVERATQLNCYQTVPILRQERLEPFQPYRV